MDVEVAGGARVIPQNRTILLVEDNDDDIELTMRAFGTSQAGHEFVVTRDGQEALDFLLASGPHAGRDTGRMPDLVLLDLNLPRLNGLEVLRRMRQDPRTALLPTVVLTTSAREEDIVRTYELGANSYVRKPIDLVEFVSVAGQLSAYWLVLNEAPVNRH